MGPVTISSRGLSKESVGDGPQPMSASILPALSSTSFCRQCPPLQTLSDAFQRASPWRSLWRIFARRIHAAARKILTPTFFDTPPVSRKSDRPLPFSPGPTHTFPNTKRRYDSVRLYAYHGALGYAPWPPSAICATFRRDLLRVNS
jgi:hypothetical protein